MEKPATWAEPKHIFPIIKILSVAAYGLFDPANAPEFNTFIIKIPFLDIRQISQWVSQSVSRYWQPKIA